VQQKSKIRIAFEVIVRVVLMTCIFTLLGFAIGLFCGIGAAVLYGLLRHAHPDMTMAYRFVAVPFGVIACVISLLLMLFTEIRRLRNPVSYSRLSLRRTS
jgi:hypothetical protein